MSNAGIVSVHGLCERVQSGGSTTEWRLVVALMACPLSAVLYDRATGGARALPIVARLATLRDVASVLHNLHSHHPLITHGDVKSGNPSPPLPN